MSKIKSILPLLAFSVYFSKIVITSASLIDSSILLILAALICYLEYKQSDKKILEIEQKINALQQSSTENLNQLTEKFEKKFEEMENIRASVTGMKLASSMRPTNNR